MKKTILVFIFFLSAIYVFPQGNRKRITRLSQEESQFFEDLSDFMERGERKKQAKELIEKFQDVVQNSGYYDNLRKENVFRIANDMLSKKRALSYPHFFNLLKTLIAFSDTKESKENYIEWEKFMLELVNTRKVSLNKINTFVKNTYNLLVDRSIWESNSISWKVSSDSYKFSYDGKKFSIYFPSTDLTGYAKGDSTKIYKTSGYYFPLTKLWKGEKGLVSWEKCGLSKDSIYAELKTYSFNVKRSSYKADSVALYYPKFFKHKIYGSLEDKIVHIIKGKATSYPKFSSYQKVFVIKNIFKGVDFQGGMTLYGDKIHGSGDKHNKAKIFFYYKDTLRIFVRSVLFILKPKEIISRHAEVSFYIGKDSIYHPSLIFKYNDKNKLVQFIRDGKGLTRTPYLDTYHKLYMDVNLISWNIGTPKLDFGVVAGSTQKTAMFKSVDYFSMRDFMNLQVMDMENPLVLIRRFARQMHSDIFYDTEFANFMRLSIPDTRHYLLNVAYNGFIRYDIESGMVVVEKRLYDYLKASTGEKDYDVIEISSNVKEGKNAELSLLNNFMKIHGVMQMFLSDSQDVAIFPSGGDIVMKRNRDFDFNGKVRAGKMLFVGSNFNFFYDVFKIKLTDIKYVKIQVKGDQVDKNGMPIPVILRNKLENTTGELLIDYPQNKSGVRKRDFPQYPIFKAMEDAFVYYDSKKIFGGVYRRDKFYFQIYPFEMDSLSRYDKESVRFKGHFVSAGIFPPFDEELTVQKDYSLGFIRETPPDGMPTYGGKSKFTSKIKLSNQGLRGDGTFDYLTSTTISKDFQFFPDSMNTLAQEFVNKKQETGVEYPSVFGEKIKVHYLPYEDMLIASTTEKDFDMLDKQATLKGRLILTPSGLRGSGKMEFSKAQLFSKNFTYKANIIDADTSNFNLKELQESEFAFKTTNVNSHIDFVNRKGLFKSNGNASLIEFPQNKYVCYMDQFTWYMDQDAIEMSASKQALSERLKGVDTTSLSQTEIEDLKLEGTEFISVHPRQDSLRFKAPKAKYDLKQKIITAENVKWIRVGDATVFPGDGTVVIKKNAKMQTLENSKIVANNVTKYHTIYNCRTNIYGRRDYVSSGDYDYVDENGQKEKIHFDMISLDTAYQTYAKGKIGITDNFTLSPQFMFTGTVYLYASKKNLTFDGYTKLSHECESQKRYWVKFKNEIDPKEIYIPIGDTILDINNKKLYAGFFVTKDSSHLYTAFLTTRKRYSDIQMLKAKGYLYFDKEFGKYEIASKDKLVEQTLPGNFMSIHKTICNAYGEGKLNIGANLGQVKLLTVGDINANLKDTTYRLDLLMGVDFFFNNDAMKIFVRDLKNATDLEPLDVSSETYTKGLAEIVGKDKAEELISEMSIKGEMKKVPEEMRKTVFLSQLNMKWDTKIHSFVSDGPIGIGNIGNEQINKLVNGIVVLTKKRSGDVLTMYFKLGDGWWYYFEYARGVMRTVSSVDEFNTAISTMKPEDRRLKVSKGEKPYSYYPTTQKIVKKFLRQFEDKGDENDDNEDGENVDDE